LCVGQSNRRNCRLGMAVCELMAPNVGSLVVSVGSQPFVFARIVGSKAPLFASP
jgi:hypothetical protein